MSVAIYSTDLMVISTISGTARQFGQPSVSVSTPADFLARAPADVQVVFVDLDAIKDDIEQLVRSLRSHAPYAKIAAFGQHVHSDRLEAAQTAGCDKVLTRGQLFRDLSVMLGQGVF